MLANVITAALMVVSIGAAHPQPPAASPAGVLVGFGENAPARYPLSLSPAEG